MYAEKLPLAVFLHTEVTQAEQKVERKGAEGKRKVEQKGAEGRQGKRLSGR